MRRQNRCLYGSAFETQDGKAYYCNLIPLVEMGRAKEIDDLTLETLNTANEDAKINYHTVKFNDQCIRQSVSFSSRGLHRNLFFEMRNKARFLVFFFFVDE